MTWDSDGFAVISQGTLVKLIRDLSWPLVNSGMFESGKKKGTVRRQPLSAARTPQPVITPRVDQATIQRRAVSAYTFTPVVAQTQAVQPIMRASDLHHAEVHRLSVQRQALQKQMQTLPLVSTSAMEAALQRQQSVPAAPPLKPQSIADWVTVMRFQAEQAEGRFMQSRESIQFAALQRQVTQTLTQGYLRDRQPALQRQAEYAGHVAALQRHPLSGVVGQVFMRHIPPGERPTLQRAVDEIMQRQAEQDAQDQAALQRHGMQRRLAELDQEATIPVFERIQSRRGSGNPLPEAVQRHLEHGLNHDLSSVRIHDDAEADKMAKDVNAIAFTTGKDIFFQSGKFNPNTQSGLELLAHEVTHTVQQSKGQVGKGIDPDSGLESEAQSMGRKLASRPVKLSKRPVKPLSPLRSGGGFALKGLQRAPTATQLGSTASTTKLTFKIGEAAFWQAMPGGMFEGAKQSLVDVWELIKNLPVITRELPELTRKALSWLRTMDTMQEWKAVAQALAMGALTAGQNWLKKTAQQQGQQVGWFVGQLIGQVALGKGAGAAVKAVKGGGGLVKWFEDFMRKVQIELKKLDAKLPRVGSRSALAGAGGDVRAVPTTTPTSNTRVNTARRNGSGSGTVTPDPRDLDVKKLMGHIPDNFTQVRDLIGMPFDETKLPKDYYVKTMGGVKVIVRKTADDKKFTPLTIDSNTRVQVNVSQRLSNPNTMKKNFKSKWGDLPNGHWIHHLIPDTLIRNHPVGKTLQKLGFSVDEGENLLNLPGKGVFDGNVDVVGHWTDHPKYTQYVRDQLNILEKAFPLDNLSKEQEKQLLKAVETLEKNLRKKLEEGFFEKRPDGSLAAAPGQAGGKQA